MSEAPWLRKPSNTGIHTLLEGKIMRTNRGYTRPQNRVSGTPIMSVLEKEIRKLKKELNTAYRGQIPNDWCLVIKNSPVEILRKVSEAINSHEFSKTSPIHFAAENGLLKICQHIMDIQCIEDKNPKDQFGDTPLHLATKKGHADVCKLIIDNVANKNPKNNHGETPLHKAAQNGNVRIFKYIVKHVEDKNPVNDFQQTPLDVALANNNHNVVNYIIMDIDLALD